VTLVRRLDHVAILVRSTAEALRFYEGHLGLRVHSSEEISSPRARLTYLDTGNAYLQLLEPLDAASPLAAWLDEHGEGLHHICFGVDDVAEAVAAIGDPGSPVVLGEGRGRVSGFLTAAGTGVRIECTEFDKTQDVDAAPGWLETSGQPTR
jgi:methylmalonyl-CoA/ethylmalonyl-CoA epimerase